MKSLLLLLLFLLSIPAFAASPLQLGGHLQDDVVGLLKQGNGEVGNMLEGKLILQYRGQGWRLYNDLRFYHASGELFKNEKEVSASLIRSFIRISPLWMELTIGKTYINFGAPVLFNPFEMDKTLAFSDLARTKAGRAALSLNIPVSDFSGIKTYIAPGRKDPEDSGWAAGGSFYARPAGIDFALIYNRLDRDNNIVGISLKGDLILGVTLAGALHCDDSGRDTFLELTSTLDYSFGSLVVSVGGYYNGRGTEDTSEYGSTPPEESYSLGKFLLFTQNSYRFDEFTSITLDGFFNLHDTSGLVVPGLLWTARQGLTLNVALTIPFGKDGGEFAPSRQGDLGILIRTTANF